MIRSNMNWKYDGGGKRIVMMSTRMRMMMMIIIIIFSFSLSFTKSLSLTPLQVIRKNNKPQYRMLPSLSLSSLSTKQPTTTTTTRSSSTTKLSLSIDDMMYNAQSTASSLASESLLSSTTPTSLAILYFAGLLTSFSPCSLGLLPITISYITNAAGERDDKDVFLPTIAFAFGLAFVFCGLGLSVSLLGGVFGGGGGGSNSSDNIWSTFALASLSSGISIAMGLQLLEIVNLPLPSLDLGDLSSGNGGGLMTTTSTTTSSSSTGTDGSLVMMESSEIAFDDDGNIIMQSSQSSQSSLSSSFNDNNNDSGNGSSSGSSSSALFRTFLLGGSSALVASPCATPVLTSILAFVAASRNPGLGTILLFIYSIGYSTPLLIVGASGGQALVNIQTASSTGTGTGGNGNGDGNDTLYGKIGQYVNPITACILIYYGTTGMLEALFGDPSMSALAPILD